ncbi:hypothetical protein FYK55_16815 [Roseiconus nitratireducens]|uniref:Secreted protein n=1 Tax=Roseiconus nitratireducens TaxID=2605748 RepID=A0A5M6D3F5_9BACT|nr:hypothetical protein [Roseiconus nitratireducens]KAA5541863.1 hypothetical protein FYK55_16815 [Roseiconus nitratireducens]
MKRRFILPSAFAALAVFAALPGCGGSGGEATYDSSQAAPMTAEEEAEAENYMEEYNKQNQRMRQEGN